MNTTSIKTYLHSFHILSDNEIEDFIQFLSPKTIQKSEYFIREGQTCQMVAFVQSGSLRSFYTSDKGEEITYCISFPNILMTAYSSFLTEKPSQENIQAITKTELLTISKESIDKLVYSSTNWILFMKIMAEQQYLELENRIFQLLRNDAKQRYIDLMENHPEYLQKIPLQYLASYLGITQRHLSRIRKEVVF